MPWFEAHDTMARHPKTLKLARLLGVDRRYAVGVLHDLFSWGLYAADKDGLLDGLVEEDIAQVLDFTGKRAGVIVPALLGAGFLEGEPGAYILHDWYDYAGKLCEQKEAQKEYKARKYSLYNDLRLTKAVRARDGDFCRYCGKRVNWTDRKGVDGGTYDHVDPDGGNSMENVVVACRSCNSRKKHRTPSEAKMPLLNPQGSK